MMIESGAVLRKLRKQCKLTQVQLAKLSGVSVRTISTFEVYDSKVGKKYANLFAAIFESRL